MRRHITILALAVILLAGGVLAAAQGNAARASSSPSRTALRVGWLEKPDSLNPFIGIQTVSYLLYHLNYDFLVRYDPDTLEPSPGLATKWSHSPDGRTWTFTLREGVTWQDGRPFTADDVVYTFDLVKDTPMSSYSSYTQGITDVRAVGDHRVVFRTASPKADMLQMWVPIVPEHVWSKVGAAAAEKTFANTPPVVGTGPFQIAEWKPGSFVRLTANKAYWGGAPKVDEIVFVMYTNADTLSQDLKNGTIQFGQVSPASFSSFRSLPGFSAQLATESGYDDLGFNCYEGPSKGNPVVRDPAFRRAVAWAIDPAKIAAVAYGGSAIPATSILPSGYYDPAADFHWQPDPAEVRSYDPEKARQLLDAAGYRDADGDGVRDYQGKPIRLRLWSITDKPEYDLSGKLIAGWLKDVGLQVSYQSMDEAALSDGIYNTEGGKLTPDFDLFLWNWNGDFDPGFLLSVLLTSQIGSWSDTGWSNAEYDRLYAEQSRALDPQKRRDLILRMQQIVYDECPYVPLVYPQNREVCSTAGWAGWVHQPARTGTVSNVYTYAAVHRMGEDTADGKSQGLWLLPILLVGGTAVGVWLLLRRRRRARSEEE